MEKGIFYGVGVGPGDPELMTLKAVRLIRENEIIAVPGEKPEESVAYRIALAAVPELKDKQLLAISMPMTHDRARMRAHHEQGAAAVEAFLREGRHVIFLTLGDPAIYSTFTYLQKLTERDGYRTELISGVPSFCAAAARIGMPLAEWNDSIHVYPAVHQAAQDVSTNGTCVMMKAGRRLGELKKLAAEQKRELIMIESCGMEGERIILDRNEIPDRAGYYTLAILRKR